MVRCTSQQPQLGSHSSMNPSSGTFCLAWGKDCGVVAVTFLPLGVFISSSLSDDEDSVSSFALTFVPVENLWVLNYQMYSDTNENLEYMLTDMAINMISHASANQHSWLRNRWPYWPQLEVPHSEKKKRFFYLELRPWFSEMIFSKLNVYCTRLPDE